MCELNLQQQSSISVLWSNNNFFFNDLINLKKKENHNLWLEEDTQQLQNVTKQSVISLNLCSRTLITLLLLSSVLVL